MVLSDYNSRIMYYIVPEHRVLHLIHLDAEGISCSRTSSSFFVDQSSSLPAIFDNPFHSCLATELVPFGPQAALCMTGSRELQLTSRTQEKLFWCCVAGYSGSEGSKLMGMVSHLSSTWTTVPSSDQI